MADTQATNPPNNTVYVKNLEERIKLPVLITNLRETFEAAGNVLDVIAKSTLKGRGQAFIVFEDTEAAQDAVDTLQDFELFGKPMKLDFAKTRSDKTVEREDGPEALAQHVEARKAEKKRKQDIEEAEKASKKRTATAAGMNNNAAPSNKKLQAANQIQEDEYLPPNKILVLRDVDHALGKQDLAGLFGQFPAFKEVRMVPTRPGVAFVEYLNQDGAIAAKQAIHNTTVGAQNIRVTYQKQ